MQYNSNFKNIAESYLFAEVADRSAKYAKANPDKKVIKLGIGDVTLPLAPVVISALHEAVDEMAVKETFKGYGPYEGYAFLREAIQDYYKSFGVEVGADEIFVSDGAKSDLGNILDIFAKENTILVPDPVYPVYVDTNVMAGRKVVFADATEANGFLPMPDYKVDADVIYICSPNNPTGAAYTVEQLKEWVKYALEKGAVILYDAAYESFITVLTPIGSGARKDSSPMRFSGPASPLRAGIMPAHRCSGTIPRTPDLPRELHGSLSTPTIRRSTPRLRLRIRILCSAIIGS